MLRLQYQISRIEYQRAIIYTITIFKLNVSSDEKGRNKLHNIFLFILGVDHKLQFESGVRHILFAFQCIFGISDWATIRYDSNYYTGLVYERC